MDPLNSLRRAPFEDLDDPPPPYLFDEADTPPPSHQATFPDTPAPAFVPPPPPSPSPPPPASPPPPQAPLPGSLAPSSVLRTPLSRYPPVMRAFTVPGDEEAFELGATKTETKFRLCVGSNFATKFLLATVHDGLKHTEESCIVTAKTGCCALHAGGPYIYYHGHPSHPHLAQDIKLAAPKELSWGQLNAVEFTCETDMTGAEEVFQWRATTGKEVKRATGCSSGFKLVWVRGPKWKLPVSGKKKGRAEGLTSDGNEVVAVVAHSPVWGEGFIFAFMGHGLHGVMGDVWESVALASGFTRWWSTIDSVVTIKQ